MKRLNEMEQCCQKSGSLYDFIYLDKVRINTLLSQLSNEGITSELKKSFVDSEADHGAAGLNISLFSLNKDKLTTFEDRLEKSIDTSWILPMVLLNEINDYIKHNPESPMSGDLVLISGEMLLLDFPTLKKNLSLLKHMIKQNNKNKIERDTSLGMKLLDMLPSTIQLRMKEKNNKYWTTLEPDFFTINSEDLSLKYGSILSGDWHILAYVDFTPNKEKSLNKYISYFEEETESTLMHQSVIDVFVSNMDSLRSITGCNDEEYALSPIMIFKSVR